jgi:ubiquinol-cytochrome c reductase cytochrome c subunit
MKMSRFVVFGVAGVIGMMAVAASAQQKPAAPAAPAAVQPAAAPSGNVENGKKLYEQRGCADCHGMQGQGAPTSGPRIVPPLPLVQFIRYARAPRVQMPPYTEKVMPDSEFTDVRAYLVSLPKPAPVTVLGP